MDENKKCPKCGEKMNLGQTGAQGEMRIRKPGDFYGDVIVPLYCQNCGYIEWYIEKKLINKNEDKTFLINVVFDKQTKGRY
jgi:predicted nucleic-acid-binding Zn-ribbon protein